MGQLKTTHVSKVTTATDVDYRDPGCVRARGGWQTQWRKASSSSLNSLSHASECCQLTLAAKLTKGYTKLARTKLKYLARRNCHQLKTQTKYKNKTSTVSMLRQYAKIHLPSYIVSSNTWSYANDSHQVLCLLFVPNHTLPLVLH